MIKIWDNNLCFDENCTLSSISWSILNGLVLNLLSMGLIFQDDQLKGWVTALSFELNCTYSFDILINSYNTIHLGTWCQPFTQHISVSVCTRLGPLRHPISQLMKFLTPLLKGPAIRNPKVHTASVSNEQYTGRVDYYSVIFFTLLGFLYKA